MIGCGTVGGGVLELLDRQARRDRRALRRAVPRHPARGPRPATSRAPASPPASPRTDARAGAGRGSRGRRDRRGRRRPARSSPRSRAALAAGKPVVTANKALLAQQARRARRARAAHRDAAAVRGRGRRRAADHPPPVAPRRRDRQPDGDRQRHLQLHHHAARAGRAGRSIARSPRPRRLGLAEADPSADLDGLDAAAKLSILAYRAFGAWLPPDTLPVRGIGELVAGRLRSRRGDGVPDPADRARGAARRAS